VPDRTGLRQSSPLLAMLSALHVVPHGRQPTRPPGRT
jgi:hypothetical protein